ncbi:hypothetical protein HXX76_010730 [Chlamydomonas incerta]|uniref:PATROL1-like C-terminal domain-containing protein n=1 Tax=Chlamydomonas incerta TaxID=51695 RepID=A0A835VXR7_CHLIN|nr:hypothetical protein HXX76_010730 [Chlamydomonas incerta]|eukprot:KAG2429494.1 hypothetical protein HXX76_010730 [Chlamydomonas incerta]
MAQQPLRDVWGERRDLVEYLLKDHVKRGGKLVTAPQTALYDPKIIDNLNINVLIRQVMVGGAVDLPRLVLPVAMQVNGANAAVPPPKYLAGSAAAGGAADNPFGAAPASQLSSATAAAPDNPFGAPVSGPASAAASARHSHKPSADNPFAGGAAPAAADNPFGGAPSGRGAVGASLSAGDGAMFAAKSAASTRKGLGGPGEPPVTALASGVKLSYSLAGGGAAAATDASGRGGGGGGGAAAVGEETPFGGVRPPRLDLPELETGQSEEQLRDLAFLLFAAVAASGAGGLTPQQAAGLTRVLAQQLCVEEARVSDIQRLLRHIQPGGAPTLVDGMGGSWPPARRASLELLLALLVAVRPSDFSAASPARAFKSFLRWKDVTVAVLEQQLAAAAGGGGWVSGDQAQLKKLLARLHGAARRADVRGESDYEEEEYGEAVGGLAGAVAALAAGCGSGLRFPWAVRVRLAEILITALFDTVEEGTYIDEAALVLQFLDGAMWPALGLSPPAALAVSAWVHFSMYVGTGCREQRLVKQLKGQIGRLAVQAEAGPQRKPADPFGLGEEALSPMPSLADAPPRPAGELAQDGALSVRVAGHIVDWVFVRLCDYHAAFPRGENLGPLLDVFVFAARSRGDSAERLAGLLTEAICDSGAAAFGRAVRARVDAAASGEARLLEMATIAHELHDADNDVYVGGVGVPGGGGGGFGSHLPAAGAVAAVQLHGLYGAHLRSWLASVSGVNSAVLDVFRTANALEQRLDVPVNKARAAAAEAAGGGGASNGGANGTGGGAGLGLPLPLPAAVSDVVGSYSRWDLMGPLKTGLMQWVATQSANMTTWAARALSTEKWKALGSGPEAAHTGSAAEVARMTSEALDALYGMDVPMPPGVLEALMEGVDGVLRKYVTHVNDKLGPLQRLIPPVPPLTRYKKDVVVKQEAAEVDTSKPGSKSTNKKPVFLYSVPGVEASSDFTNVHNALTVPVVAAAACSLNYLHTRAEALAQAARDKHLQCAALHPTFDSPAAPAPGASPAKAAPAAGGATSSPVKSEAGEPAALLAGALAALSTGVVYACKWLATRVVFWDQRFGWLELLYRHHVSNKPAARIEPLLDALHKVLGAVCPGLPDTMRTTFAKCLFQASVQALERVYLDGGPCRWYIVQDVPALEQDQLKLRALFFADGEGLGREALDAELERLGRLLPLMRTEVGPLMDLLKTARAHGTAQLTGPSGALGAAYDESTIMRVIAHRPERTGSKLLKTLYKLSKRIK